MQPIRICRRFLAVVFALQACVASVSCTATPNAPSDAKAAADTSRSPECTSLLGTPLYALPLSPKKLGERLELLLLAEAEFARAPALTATAEAAAIWVGRQLAYLGRYRDAIAFYTRSLSSSQFPSSYRLLRHRGHRYLTLRAFSLAEADLTTAWSLASSCADAIEADGLPTPGVPPRSTDHGNILYHLALAKYLGGDFSGAASTLSLALDCATNDDSRVSCAYWLYLSASRAGASASDSALATRALASVRTVAEGGMDVRENATYWNLCLVFKGVLDPSTLTAADGSLGIGVDKATLEYGLSMHDLLRGDTSAARARWKRVVTETDWPAFGHIAAEADLARARGS